MKDLTRKKLRLIRDSLSPEARVIAENTINQSLKDFINNGQYKVVAGYYPINSELSILQALEECGVYDICLPRIEQGGLVFKKWLPQDPIELNKYCYEPLANSRALQPDLIIIPCLGYDLQGNRLGYGAGYYDRALKLYNNATKVLVAFSEQEVQELETDEWDVKVDFIINEVAIFKVSQ
jgi:5-formyltetrahydrofolate cyclo-ligase